MGVTAFASLIWELCRLCFLVTIPLPTVPGFTGLWLPWTEPSVSITILWSVTRSKYCFFCFFRYKFVWQCECQVRDTEYFKEEGISCWDSNEMSFRFLEMVVKSCLTGWSRWDRGVDLLPIIFFSMLLEIYFSFFWKSLIASVLCSSSSLDQWVVQCRAQLPLLPKGWIW